MKHLTEITKSMIAVSVFFILPACTVVQVDFANRTATVMRFASDAALETATYEGPDGHKVSIGGYSSTQRIDAIIKLLEAAR